MADQVLTPEAVEHANSMLSFLSNHAQQNWQEVMKEALTNSEVESNTRTMESKLRKFELEEPVGAVLGGTGVAKEESGLGGEDGQIAIEILKQTGRLQQCGRGRGKCLIILTDRPIEPEAANPPAAVSQEPAASADQQEASPSQEVAESESVLIDAEDVPGLVRAIRDSYRGLQRELNETTRAIRKLEKDKQNLVNELEAERERANNLESQLEHQQVASWA